MKRLNYRLTVIVGILISILSIVFYCTQGYLKIDFLDVFKVIFLSIFDNESARELYNKFYYIIIQIRLPRILMSFIAGAGLSISGVVFQSILKNPLADPYTLGISSGAALGASLAFVFNITIFGFFSPHIMSFLFAFLSLLFVIRISKVNGRSNNVSLILAGIIVGAFLSAFLSLIKFLADEEVSGIIFWIMGSLASKGYMEVLLSGIILIISFIIFLIYSKELNILSLGEKSALSLGIDTEKIRIFLLLIASLITSIIVSICGIIGFIGLVIPHIIRYIFGANTKKVLTLSFIYGGIILSFADNFIRSYLPHEIPIGIITSLIGAPFFIFVLKNKIGGVNND